ncbi:MAG: hypothetical protein BWY72_01417 [Bacteroidetes bacterium ADurb.Bin416]|nr:MAG: hypothetical protein BWY72_01417 [Bacteroidetes bacterium ADurb.Bin416]
MGYGSQVHDLLYRTGGQQGTTRLTYSHHILVVTEDRQGLG